MTDPDDIAAARADVERLRARDPIATAREHVRQGLIVDPVTVRAVLDELDQAVRYRAEGWTRYHATADQLDAYRERYGDLPCPNCADTNPHYCPTCVAAGRG